MKAIIIFEFRVVLCIQRFMFEFACETCGYDLLHWFDLYHSFIMVELVKNISIVSEKEYDVSM